LNKQFPSFGTGATLNDVITRCTSVTHGKTANEYNHACEDLMKELSEKERLLKKYIYHTARF
jgi:hypothetical protein